MARSAFVLLALVALTCGQQLGEWRIINGRIETIDTGVAFTSPMVGYTCGDMNGVGPEIYKTTDGGHNWDKANGTLFTVALALSIAANENNVVVSGVPGEVYSEDAGANFRLATGGGVSQAIRHIGQHTDDQNKFGAAGIFGLGRNAVDGVAVSVNGGRTYTRHDAKLWCTARYGAWPTENTWYVAAGDWPQNAQVPASDPPTSEGRKFPTRARKSEFQDAEGHIPLHYVKPTEVLADGYMAQIAKTTDAGATWTTVFGQNGTFYFNGIDCAPNDADSCCAVGEASGSAEAGARVYCTTDGGTTWTRNFWMPSTSKEGFSLMEIRYATTNDVYAVGGDLHAVAPAAMFIESHDGGKTWTQNKEEMLGYFAFGLDMLSPKLGFAAVDDVITQMSGVAKYS